MHLILDSAQTRPQPAALTEFRILILASLALSALSYVTNIFLASKLGPEVFGRYSYALALGALFGEFIYFGTAETGMRLKTSHGDSALGWILTVKLLNFGLLLCGVVVGLAFGGDVAALFGLVVALNSLCFSTQYEANSRNGRYAIIFLLERVIITASFWIGLLMLEAGHMAWCFSTLLLVQGGSLAFQYWENRRYRLSFDRSALFQTYKDGFFVLIFGLSKFAFGGVTRILIFKQLGDERMGIFSVAWQFLPLLTLYFAQATKVWRLRITEALDSGDALAARKQILALCAAIFLPTLSASLIVFFFGHQIITFLFTEAFADAGGLMPYIGVYFLVAGFDSVAILLAIALSMSRVASVIYLIFGSATVLACLLFMGNKGLEAYLMTIIVGHLCAASLLTLIIARKIGRTER